MNSLVGQRLWKWKLVAGLLTIVLGAIVLAWPGPTILVASTLFGVYLLLSGLAELFGPSRCPDRRAPGCCCSSAAHCHWC